MMTDLITKIKFIVKDGFLHIMIGNTLSKMIAFLSSILIVRLVNKTDYGYLAYADNLYAYINLFAGLGLSMALLKYCSPLKSAEENKYYYLVSLKYGTIFQIVITMLMLVYVNLRTISFPSARGLLNLLIIYPAAVNILNTIQSYMRSQMKNKLYANIGIIQTILVFIFSVLLTILLGIKGVIYSRYIASFLTIYLSYVLFLKKEFKMVNINKVSISSFEKKEFWRMAISLMIANLFSMIMPINEMYIINSLIKDETITATYKVATLIPSQIVFIINSIVIYTFPKISELSQNKKLAYKKIKEIGAYTAVIITIVTIIGILTNPAIINMLYGSAYKDSIGLSRVFWISFGLNATLRIIPMNMLPALGYTNFNTVISIFSFIIHGLLEIYFISTYGIMGAAYAIILVYLVTGISYWIYLKHVCNK